MQKLIDEIKALELRSKELEPSAELRDSYLNETQSFVQNFLNVISTKAGYSNKTFNGGLPITGSKRSLTEILDYYKKEVSAKGIQAASAAHLGYIPGGGLYAAALGDYLADISNEYAGIYFASPGAVTMEHDVLNWIKELFGFPKSSVGNLTSGGSIANLIALTAARDKFKVKGTLIEKHVIYMSKHVHHCINKAIRIVGLEDIQVREISLDDRYRLDTKQLSKQIKNDKENGLTPFMVIASAGTTDTGAVDPLTDIGAICQKHKMWYHIDAAYGGFFILLDRCQNLFKGIEMANSLVVDPHKGLFLPYGVGAVLVKDKMSVMHSHHYSANYMQDAVGDNLPINPADVSPELSKHFRALRVWLPLQLHGISPFKACLEEKILHIEYCRIQLREMGFMLGPDPDLSVTFFWHPQGDDKTKLLLEKIHEDGQIFLSSSVIDQRFVIRVAILSFRSKIETIDRLITMLRRCLNQIG